MEEAVSRVGAAVQGDRPFRVLVTNANKAWQAARDPELCALLEDAELLVPEYAMVWAARRLGRHDVQHIGGIRLMVRLLYMAEAKGLTVFFLGATPEASAKLAGRVSRDWPRLRVVGLRHGYFTGSEWDQVIGELARVRPDLLFVGMGSPLQEQKIAELARRVPELRVAMGVGGSFDVLAGIKRDAPRWAQGRGLEWLFRLGQDPRRLWKRYLITNPWFVTRVLRERFRTAARPAQE